MTTSACTAGGDSVGIVEEGAESIIEDGMVKDGTDSDSESILNGTLNAKLNRLYQCQSKIYSSLS